MVFERSSLRYAHTNGHTEVIYAGNGDNIITCGSDGDIRKWSGIEDDDPSSTCLGEFVICIAYHGERLLASTDRNTIQAYSFPGMDKDGTLMRFTASANCLFANDVYVAAGSEDTSIKVLRQKAADDASDEQKLIELEGHTAPVLALDVCSSKHLLASIGGDGQLKIWRINEAATLQKSIGGLPRVNSFELAECFGTPRFEPRQGNLLAYVKAREVIVLNVDSWEVSFVLTDERISSDAVYTCCAFTQDGLWLAAGSNKGDLSIWDFVRKQAVKCEAPPYDCQAITSLAWHPDANKHELAYCDASGQLGTLFTSNLTAKGKKNSAAASTLMDMEADEVDFGDIEFEKDDDVQRSEFGGDNFDGDDDNDDDADGVSIEKLKSRVMKSAEAFANGLHADDDGHTRDSAQSVGSAATHSEAKAAHIYAPKLFKQQVAFQPSATPASLEHRYLVWNNVGIVCAHADAADGSIDVEFHDASVHHSLHIPNYAQHNMASLSQSVLALAAEGVSKLVCIALAASGNKEWSVHLPDVEGIEALAATNKLVAVATSAHFLRLFTVMGTQREVISIPGPVLAMSGCEERLIVCYHSAAPSEHQQHLSALLIQTVGLNLLTQTLTLPLPPKRTLSWLGFTERGAPAFADHMGLVQIFSMRSHCWHPICDTLSHSQSISNNYFIISICEQAQIVQAVLCRGTSYPMTNPRPMMQELPMHLPLCDADTEKSTLEDALLRASIMSTENADKTIKESAIKLFALACRSEVELRAKELIETIACPELLALAVRYATKLGRIHLSDRLHELMPQLEAQQECEQSARQEFYANRNIAHAPLTPSFVGAVTSTAAANSNTNRLAPMPMQLGSGKRLTLKRLSKPQAASQSDSRPSTPNIFSNSEAYGESQDINSENTNKTTAEEESKLSAELTRTPLNPVNPFAAKRKLGDVDFGKKSIIFGSDKLKLAKK